MRKASAAAIVLALVASTAAATFLLTRPAPTPDITMADCALWENGNVPTLPANTYTDRCWDSVHNTIAYSDPANVR